MDCKKEEQLLEGNNIFISFIIPVYNTEKNMLKRCIKSVIDLNCKNIEIIIVNDGSTENETINCLNEFSELNNIIVINKQNEGPSIARNIGMDYANGEYLFFLDSDDMIETRNLEKIIEILSQNPDVDVVYHSFDIVDDNGDIIQKGNDKKDIVKVSFSNSDRNIKSKLISDLGFDNGTIWAKFYKKTIVNNIRFDPELKYCEDNLFNILVSRNVNKLLALYIDSYIHFENPKSLCHKYNPNASIEFSLSIKKLREQLYDANNENNFHKTVIYHFYINHVLLLQVFNDRNKKTFISRCRQAKAILNSEPYINSLNNIDSTELTLREKIVYCFLKKKLVWIAYKLYFLCRK